MRPVVLVLALALASASALLPSSAAAATVRQCSNYGNVEGQEPDDDGALRPRFTDEPIDGAGTYNIVAVVSSCTLAKRMVRTAQRQNNNPCYRYRDGQPYAVRNPCRILGFTCRSKRTGYESSRMRCTRRGGRIVRWDSGA